MNQSIKAIVHALVWAAVILGASWALRGTPASDWVLFGCIFGWLISHDLVVRGGAELRRDWRCIQRHVFRRGS